MKIAIIKGKAFEYREDNTLIPVDDCILEVKEKKVNSRTLAQNRSIHLYCKQVAQALNNNGHTVTAVLKPEIQFSMITVKEQLYKPILSALRGKESTTQITSKEMNDVYDVMNKALGERFGISIPFPSQEELNFNQNYKEK